MVEERLFSISNDTVLEINGEQFGEFPNRSTGAVSGVYVITHVASGKMYVGSSSNLYQRKYSHISQLRHNRHANPELQAAYNSDPALMFKALVTSDNNSALDHEQSILDTFPKNELLFNKATDARRPGAGLECSLETRQKIGNANRGRYVGQTLSQEHRDKISRARTGVKLSEEHKKHLSESHKGNHSGNTRGAVINGVTYDTIPQASKALGIKPATIYQRLHSDSNSFKDWNFKDKEK